MVSKVLVHQHVYEQGRRPRKEVGAVPHPARRIEVLVGSSLFAQFDDRSAQTFGVLVEAVLLEAVHQEPVYVDPDGPRQYCTGEYPKP
jgi:hypothetical protein